eukprot:gene7560-11883_t
MENHQRQSHNFFRPVVLTPHNRKEEKPEQNSTPYIETIPPQHFQQKTEMNFILPPIQPFKKQKVEPKKPNYIGGTLNSSEVFKPQLDINEFFGLLEGSNDNYSLKNSGIKFNVYCNGVLKPTEKLSIMYIIPGIQEKPTKLIEIPFFGNRAIVDLDLAKEQFFLQNIKQGKEFKLIFLFNNTQVRTPKFKIRNNNLQNILAPIPLENQIKEIIQVKEVIPGSALSFGGQFIKLYFKCSSEMMESLEPQVLINNMNATIWYFGQDKLPNGEFNVLLIETPKIQISIPALETSLILFNRGEEISCHPFKIIGEVDKKNEPEDKPAIKKVHRNRNPHQTQPFQSLPSLVDMISTLPKVVNYNPPETQNLNSTVSTENDKKGKSNLELIETRTEIVETSDESSTIASFLDKLKINVVTNQKQSKQPFEDFENSFVNGRHLNDQFLTHLAHKHFNEKNNSIRTGFLLGKYLLLRKESYKKLNGGLNGWRSFLSNIGISQYDKVNEVINLYQHLGCYKKFQLVTDSIWRVQRLALKISQCLKSKEEENQFWLNW